MDDLQSFTPLRFMPPELMGYEGHAVVVDPDVFAVGDIHELLSRDMQGKAIIGRPRSGTKGAEGGIATSVMLLDCAKLTPLALRAAVRRAVQRSSATTWTGSCCAPSRAIRSASSSTSGTTSTA